MAGALAVFGAPSLAAARTAGPSRLSKVDLSHASRCDFISAEGTECLFPWPNDYYTVGDPSTDTGRRVAVKLDSTGPRARQR